MESTLTEILASQEDLIREASLALPHDFRNCTYRLGPLRQAVYLCLTCSSTTKHHGICSACSIACHTDHEQLELFPKRNFRCDCPTTKLAHRCTLHTNLEPENEGNQYGQNFDAVFCRCGRPYDAKNERETMIQCLACEDWFHESCLNLRERPVPSRSTTPVEGSETTPGQAPANEMEEADDAASDASSSGLPPPLITAHEYESLVCGPCVLRMDTLKRWAGTPGIMMVVRDDPSAPWTVMHSSQEMQTDSHAVEIEETSTSTAAGVKRPRTSSVASAPDAKRSRSSPSQQTPCLAPPLNPVAQSILSRCSLSNPDLSLGAGDVFLVDDWRGRWCRCPTCLPSLEANPFLRDEEDTYEPPKDPDCGLSLEELGMRALQRIPRDRAIDGIHAFNAMRDDLVKYLRPFAQGGRTVQEADVRAFFDTYGQAARQRSSV